MDKLCTSNSYLDMFLHFKCASDLLKYKLFPNTKELTESLTAFVAVRKYLGAKTFGQPWTLFDVGCGSTPRTGALFAFLSRWTCFAIDPRLRHKTKWKEIQRLHCVISKIENCQYHLSTPVIIVAVHCHAEPEKILSAIHASRIILVAMPCCIPFDLPNPVLSYTDTHCWSPHNQVKIWDFC